MSAMRKRFSFCTVTEVLLLLLFLLMIPISMSYRPFHLLTQPDHQVDHGYHGDHNEGAHDEDMIQHGMEVIQRVDVGQLAAGSRLPDCSHACNSCMPCRLVIVASACASLTEAESCPISYRCMCNNKTYPVP